MIPRVSIIILNWNGWRDTVECLESLFRITYPNYDVIVVDNGSQDDSVGKIKAYCDGRLRVKSKFFEYSIENKPIKCFEISENEAKIGRFSASNYDKLEPNRRLVLIKIQRNLGFTGGSNIGVKFALRIFRPDYVLLLNNDTVVDRKFLDRLVEVAEIDENIGVVGPKVYYYNFGGRVNIIQFMGAKINSLTLSKNIYGRGQVGDNSIRMPIPTDEIPGTCMLIRKKMFQKVGLLDENYFAYWEDTDFCFNVKRVGCSLYVVPTSIIWHKVGANNPSERRVSPLAAHLFGRNAIYFIRKNLRGWNKLLGLLYWILVKFLYLTGVYLLYYRSLKAACAFALGILTGIRNKMGEPRITRILL